MKKTAFLLTLFMLCGCANDKVHTCKMASDNLNWEIQYTTDENGHVLAIEQSVSVEVKDAKEKEAYQEMFDDMFNDYIENYEGACTLEKVDLDTIVKRTLVVQYEELTAQQKDEMSFESEEKYLKAQLDYAGYTCE